MYEEVSKASIEALGEIGEISTIPYLLKVLDIEELELEYIDIDMKWFILDSIKKICVSNDQCSIDFFLAKLDTANDSLKESIAYLLGEIGNEDYVEPLLELLRERNMDIKKNTIIALGKICTLAALKPLITMLDNQDTYWLLKKVAVDALYNIYIINWVESNSHITRGERILIQNTEKIIDYLNKSENENCKVKVGVIKFLEKFGGKTALAALLRRVNDFHRIVRISASNAIKKIEARLEEALN
jgi:HEAT repeat protein